jgi:hypothetical protein
MWVVVDVPYTLGCPAAARQALGKARPERGAATGPGECSTDGRVRVDSGATAGSARVRTQVAREVCAEPPSASRGSKVFSAATSPVHRTVPLAQGVPEPKTSCR